MAQLGGETVDPPSDLPAAEPRSTYSYVHVAGPYIALTFDDGPSAKLTPKLLDLLGARHIKATFFVIGQNVVEHPQIAARAAREGHELGNHTWSHADLSKMSDDAVRRQLRQTEEAIANATGTKPAVFRPPYGSITTRQKRWLHHDFGYHVILWDVDPLDWKRPGPAVVANRIVKTTRAGSIVLAHDIHPGTLAAMPLVLDQLQAKGFQFVTVSELLDMAVPETPAPPTKPRRAEPVETMPERPGSTTASPSAGG